MAKRSKAAGTPGKCDKCFQDAHISPAHLGRKHKGCKHRDNKSRDNAGTWKRPGEVQEPKAPEPQPV